MSRVHGSSTRWKLMVAAAAAVLVIASGSKVYSASPLGELQVQGLTVGNGAIAQCSETQIVLDQVRTGYVASAYRVVSVRFASVPPACVGSAFSLVALDASNGNPQLAQRNGTVPASGGTVTLGSTGPNLNSINVSNNEVRLAVAVYSQ